jgi:ferric-dicitrate binding protein FerR (iron transport regulator)
MLPGTHVASATAFETAWALFCRMHDAPSPELAVQLVRWLAEDPRHVRALDEALTLWALTGAALVESALEEAPRRAVDLQ